MVRIYEKRIDWLSVASRRIWGSVCERRYRTLITLFLCIGNGSSLPAFALCVSQHQGIQGRKIVRFRNNSCRYDQCKQSAFKNRYWYSAFLMIQWIYWIRWWLVNTKLQFPWDRMRLFNLIYLASKPLGNVLS